MTAKKSFIFLSLCICVFLNYDNYHNVKTESHRKYSTFLDRNVPISKIRYSLHLSFFTFMLINVDHQKKIDLLYTI